MKSLTRDPTATARARRAEERDLGGLGIKPISFSASLGNTGGGGGGAGDATTTGSTIKSTGFKKGGFRNAFAPIGGASEGDGTAAANAAAAADREGVGMGMGGQESGTRAEERVRDREGRLLSGKTQRHEEGEKREGIDDGLGDDDNDDDDDEDEDADARWGDYDPRHPTGCMEGCVGWIP